MSATKNASSGPVLGSTVVEWSCMGFLSVHWLTGDSKPVYAALGYMSLMKMWLMCFCSYTDEIHGCDALQSSSVYHRIDQREWSCSSGLPPSWITHESQHD